MAARLSPARAQWASDDEKFAFYRRRDHDHIEAVQDYVIARLAELAHERRTAAAEQAGLDPALLKPPLIPPKARQTISNLQGAHGGGAVPFEEFERDQLSLAALFGFTGKDSARRSRVRGWLRALDNWQYAVGRQLFTIIPGGQVVGKRDDGTPIRSSTKFIDHILPLADAAVQRARVELSRAYDEWRRRGEQGPRPNVGAYLAAQSDWVIAQLPKLGTPAESRPPSTPPDLAKRVETRRKFIEGHSKGIADELTAGDLISAEEIDERLALLEVAHEKAVRALDDHYLSARKILTSLRQTTKQRAANLADAAELVAPVDEILDDRAWEESERAYHEEKAARGGLCNKKLTQGNIGDFADFMLRAALEYAKHGWPVFAVKPDKTPYTRNGFKDATTDAAALCAMWQRWPDARIGIPTGKVSGLLVLDVDPRHGGDASLSELISAHGDFETLTARTPSDGRHYAFAYNALPADIEIGNSAGKLGPGLDVRGAGGYIVAPPGDGRAWLNAKEPAAPPPWLVELLLAQKTPPINQDYQPRPSRSTGIGAVIPDGQRGTQIFKIGCAIWGKGEATGYADLLAQLIEINERRCAPPMEYRRVVSTAASIAGRYPLGQPIAQTEVERGAEECAREVFEL